MELKVGDSVQFVEDFSINDGDYRIVWPRGCMARIEAIKGNNAVIDGGRYEVPLSCFGASEEEKHANDKHNILNGLTNNSAIKPDYYKYRGGDVFDMAKHFGLDFTLGNALKYLLRAGHKDPAKKVEDLNKCIECIKRHIELEG
jgi:hypothetical protein